jgi:hypothetical protein
LSGNGWCGNYDGHGQRLASSDIYRKVKPFICEPAVVVLITSRTEMHAKADAARTRRVPAIRTAIG